MKHKPIIILLILCLAFLSMACLIDMIRSSQTGKMGVNSVEITPPSGSGVFKVLLSITLHDRSEMLTCSYYDEKAKQTNVVYQKTMPANTKSQLLEFEFTATQPGSYTLSCHGENIGPTFSASSGFTVTQPQEQPTTTPGSGSAVPKPGDFRAAGMWMTFDKGTSSIANYGVPQQCLPGVNYTHAGGTSSFDIDPAGNMTGSCYLTYSGGATRLTGTMDGFWDGTKDEITFRLETVTESDYSSPSGETGFSKNTTIFSGTARFVSPVQAAGVANWYTDCTATGLNTCFSDPYTTSLHAEGTVPFVINFVAP